MTPIQIVADVSQRLEAQGIRHLVGGSFASSAWGEIRATNDVDIEVLIDRGQVDLLAAAFTEPYYASLPEIEGAFSGTSTYRSTHAIHMDEAFQIDLFLVRPDAYSLTEFARARLVEVSPGISVPFAAPENIVIQKLRWFEHGNRISDRQWNDIIRVLEIQRFELDYSYLEYWANQFELSTLLDEALTQLAD